MAAERIEKLKAFYAAVVTGDIAGAESHFAADRLVIREAENLPYGGVYHGSEGYRSLMRGLMAAWKRVRFDNFRFAAGDDFVAAYFTMSAVARSTGTEASFSVVEVFEFDGDRIVAIAPFYWDTHAMRKALGLS